VASLYIYGRNSSTGVRRHVATWPRSGSRFVSCPVNFPASKIDMKFQIHTSPGETSTAISGILVPWTRRSAAGGVSCRCGKRFRGDHAHAADPRIRILWPMQSDGDDRLHQPELPGCLRPADGGDRWSKKERDVRAYKSRRLSSAITRKTGCAQRAASRDSTGPPTKLDEPRRPRQSE